MKDLELWQQHAVGLWVSTRCDAHLTWPSSLQQILVFWLSLSHQTDWLCCRATHPTQFKHLLPGEESSLKGPVFSHSLNSDCTGLE